MTHDVSENSLSYGREKAFALNVVESSKKSCGPSSKNNLPVKPDIAPDGFNNFPLQQRMKKLKHKEMNEINKY